MRIAVTVLGIVALGCLLTACTRGSQDPGPLLPQPSVGSPTPATTPSRTPLSTPIVPSPRPSSAAASPSPTGFSAAYVVYCNGHPTGAQVIAAVRKTRGNLPAGNGVAVKNQPLCAGMWQYTILNVTDSEPLQVITKGDPAALVVVTAGTDPCTPEVRATVPTAMLDTAGCLN